MSDVGSETPSPTRTLSASDSTAFGRCWAESAEPRPSSANADEHRPMLREAWLVQQIGRSRPRKVWICAIFALAPTAAAYFVQSRPGHVLPAPPPPWKRFALGGVGTDKREGEAPSPISNSVRVAAEGPWLCCHPLTDPLLQPKSSPSGPDPRAIV